MGRDGRSCLGLPTQRPLLDVLLLVILPFWMRERQCYHYCIGLNDVMRRVKVPVFVYASYEC